MRSSFAFAVAFTALAGTAAAQRPGMAGPGTFTRSGLDIGFGIGGGSGNVSCNGCDLNSEGGTVFYFRVGGAISPSVTLDGEVNAWQHSQDDETDTFSYFTGDVKWYPQVTTGFYLLGGVGLGTTDLHATDGSGLDLTANGAAINLGLGYELHVTGRFSLTPFASYLATLGASSSVNGSSTNQNLDNHVFQFGLGFTWN